VVDQKAPKQPMKQSTLLLKRRARLIRRNLSFLRFRVSAFSPQLLPSAFQRFSFCVQIRFIRVIRGCMFVFRF